MRVSAAESFQGAALRPGPGKGEVEAAVALEVPDGRPEGIDIVRQAEIPGIENLQRCGGGERQGMNFAAVCPVISHVDSPGGNTPANQSLPHAFA
jgi:hypothetical protein